MHTRGPCTHWAHHWLQIVSCAFNKTVCLNQFAPLQVLYIIFLYVFVYYIFWTVSSHTIPLLHCEQLTGVLSGERTATAQAPIVEAWLTPPGLGRPHSCWMCWCWCCRNVSANWGRVVWQPAHPGRTCPGPNSLPPTPGACRVNLVALMQGPPSAGNTTSLIFAGVWNTASGGDCLDWEVLTWSRQLRLTQEAGVKRHHSSGWWVKLQ